MQPSRRTHNQSNIPYVQPSRPVTAPRDSLPAPQQSAPPVMPRPHAESHAAAADVSRAQINQIYETNPPHKEAIVRLTEQQAQANNSEMIAEATGATVYGKTHTRPTAASETPQLQQYHSAWQNYYRQYYERYYMHQLHATRTQLESRAQAAAQSALPASAVSTHTPAGVSPDQAVQELRQDLRQKIRNNATKVRKSRHFLPVVSALAVGLVFAFLQYNRVLVAQVYAYVSPGSINPQNIVLDPTTNISVSKEPKVIIPKINVEAPVVYGLGSIAEDAVQKALEGGVVHYPIPGANSIPGQVGNTVLLGHSSNDVFDTGGYKFIFVQLDQLKEGDTFYLHYEGTRYTYSVTKKEIIDPTEVSKLTQKTDKPLVTLLTCTPPGTALKRLLVVGEQISPDPNAANTAPKPTQGKEPQQLPSNSPTLLERIFQ